MYLNNAKKTHQQIVQNAQRTLTKTSKHTPESIPNRKKSSKPAPAAGANLPPGHEKIENEMKMMPQRGPLGSPKGPQIRQNQEKKIIQKSS